MDNLIRDMVKLEIISEDESMKLNVCRSICKHANPSRCRNYGCRLYKDICAIIDDSDNNIDMLHSIHNYLKTIKK
jgi:hypothetical protein